MVIQTLSSEDAASNATPGDSDAAEIKEPHENDVLCGRGGSINAWKGNERFRTLIEKRKRVYLTARFKREKRLIASSIVQEIHSLKPPGRFLAKNAKTGTWFVIDDDKARDKVSQALRENAPSMRAEIETELTEQRSEMPRIQPDAHPPAPPLPPHNAPPNPYYPPPGWGYFSYYGYAQLPPQHPGGPMPPPPPPAYYPGYNVEQWHAASNAALPQEHQQPPHRPQSLAPEPPPQDPKPQNPPLQQQAAAFNFSFAPKVSPMPHAQGQIPQSQNSAQQKGQPKSTSPRPRHQFHQPNTRQQKPEPQPSAQQQPRQHDDEVSLFDIASQSIFNSVASWTKDVLSIGGDMSISSNHDEHHETGSIVSKPIKYVHQPEDEKSVASRTPSVHFKDDRSISGRSLDNRRKPGRPPRIMHSSQITYPRRLKRRNSLGSSGQQNAKLSPSNGRNPMAPMNSVHLDDGNNDGMISLITTEGISSIVEEGSLMMEDYRPDMEHSHPNEEYKECDPMPSPANRRSKLSHGLGADDASNSMLTSIANQLVVGLESFDTSIGCGPDSPLNMNRGIPNEITNFSDTMAFEIEGQEVQLVDMMEERLALGENNRVLEQRLPPHEKDRMQMAWPSRVGSCHSFLNDSLSIAGTSFFSTGLQSRGDSISPASSIDMDVSSGTDPFSYAGGSVGGASLCRVFDPDVTAHDGGSHSFPSHRLHNRMSNLRSKSPLSIGSHSREDDHGSLFTRSSDKLAGGSISTTGSMEKSKSSSE